jgi:hypothetical protein
MRCGQLAAGVPVTDWCERAALGASFLCLVHCAGLPLLLAALPALSRLVALPHGFHLWALGLAVPASGAALLLGMRQHRARLPLATGCAGLALLSVGALLLLDSPFEIPVTLVGTTLLVFAHLANWRLRHRHCRHG